MPRGLDEFKEALIEGETFKGNLNKVTSLEDVFELAKTNGYDFTLEELQDSEVSDDILESIAGGKGKSSSKVETHTYNIKKEAKGTRVIFLEDG